MLSLRESVVGSCLMLVLLPGCKPWTSTDKSPQAESAPTAAAPLKPRLVPSATTGSVSAVAQSSQAPQPPESAALPVVPKAEVNPLNLEVAALEMLYQFRLTRAQLEQLARLAPTTAGPAPAPREVSVSAPFAGALQKLHDALVDQQDEDIAKMSSTLDDLRTKENPELDDVEITDEARKRVPEFLRCLSARQVSSYVTDYAEEFPDPKEKLLDAFDDVRKLPGREWEEVRDEVAGQVGWLVAGLDAAAEEKISARTVALLNKMKGLKDDDFKAKRAELEKEVQDLVGKLSPTDVLRHFVERTLAELLSNPRLAAAVEVRLKSGN